MGKFTTIWILEKNFKRYNIIWQGNSDTETLLKTIECLGIKKP